MMNPAPVTLHALVSGDVCRLRRLNALFSDVFGDAESYRDAPPSDAWLAQLLASETFIAIVAEEGAAGDGSAVVGGLSAYELMKFERERREIYIYDLAVATSHRRRGVATRRIGALKAIAARRRAYVVYVQADLGDDSAIALYTKLGRREDVLHFDIAVP